MSIIRQNKYLSEIIEILDNHRAKYRVGDIGDDEARAALSSSTMNGLTVSAITR